MATREIKYDLPLLTDTNYAVWEEHVKQCAYANSWDEATKAAFDRVQGAAVPNAALSEAKQRSSWGKVYSTLPAVVIQRIRGVQQGRTELLLAAVRDFYLKSSLASELRLEDDLSSNMTFRISTVTSCGLTTLLKH